MIKKTYYQVEAKFKGNEWRRNTIEFKSVNEAEIFRRDIRQAMETRIVPVNTDNLNDELLNQISE